MANRTTDELPDSSVFHHQPPHSPRPDVLGVSPRSGRVIGSAVRRYSQLWFFRHPPDSAFLSYGCLHDESDVEGIARGHQESQGHHRRCGRSYGNDEMPSAALVPLVLAHISHINPADRAVISNICIRCSRIAEHIGYHEC